MPENCIRRGFLGDIIHIKPYILLYNHIHTTYILQHNVNQFVLSKYMSDVCKTITGLTQMKQIKLDLFNISIT